MIIRVIGFYSYAIHPVINTGVKMTQEEVRKFYNKIEEKRLEIGDCLFSSQRHTYRQSNARRLVKLSTELCELVALIEQE